MPFPSNILKDDLLKAIAKIDKEGIPKDAQSVYYDLMFNGKAYPPKVVVSFANIFANGQELDRNSFSGGLDTPCFKLLERNGFKIVSKEKITVMQNVKIYEIKSSANDNYAVLKSKDGLHFYWNEAKFKNNEPGDYIFVINRTGGEALFTKISEKGINATYNSANNKTHFNDNHNSFDVRDEWDSFVRFEILEKKIIPTGWNWQSQLGSSEVYDLWKKELAGQTNRIEKLDDLGKIFDSGEAFAVLSQCRQQLNATGHKGLLIENMEEVLKWEECQGIINDPEFCLEKAREAYNDFLEFLATDEFYDKILADFLKTEKVYYEFIKDYEPESNEAIFLLLMGTLIAYLDSKGANKNIWNEYEDKRTFAKAGIYQNMWVRNLVRFKKQNNEISSVSMGIQNAFRYFEFPENSLTIVSEDHKASIAEKILLTEYHPANFINEIKSYFDQYHISLLNEENRTRLYSRILYHPAVEIKWKDSIRGLVAIDSNNENWMQDVTEALKGKEYIVLWWSKSPTGTTQTLAKLRKKIKADGGFDLYYIVNGMVRYRADIRDFAINSDYETKNWNHNGDVAWHFDKFEEYKDDEHSAAIVFLAENFEEIKQPFSVDKFEWYGDYTAPRRDNLQPFQDITIEEETENEVSINLIPTTSSFLFSDPYRTVLSAIKTKPFILLAGISGTGKSRLVRTLAFKTCSHIDLKGANKPGNFELIKVKPNWHDSMELVGYESRISGELEYVVTDFLRFMAKAWQYPEVPFFLCLDEMNLAPVEQYFAEYLSILETRRFHENGMSSDPFLSKNAINTYAEADQKFWKNLGIETKINLQQQFLSEGITLPPNLIIMGTVNMDETTNSFSRKVLDRAMTIEMNQVDLELALEEKSTDWAYPEIIINQQFVLGKLVEGHEAYIIFETEGDFVVKLLKRVNEKLEKTPFKMAYRVRDEVLIYCFHNSALENKPTAWLNKCLDEVIVMKILSRIEGDESKTQIVLKGLLEVLNESDFPICNAKLKEMTERLAYGYTSFWP